jgi:3-oxoacyl-[acyl-carrier-protein] synthase-3
MAKWIIKNISLRGVAACVPKNKVQTEDIPLLSEAECKRFIATVGIKSRRVAEKGVCASDLCYAAAQNLIAELEWDKNDIDALLFVSVTPDYRSPMTSCILQNKLGLSKSCFTLDVPLGCCGYLHGITVLANLMTAGNIKKGLLLAGDTVYQTSSFEDKSRLPIFGDAGSASAFEYNENTENIISYSCSDGSGYQAIMYPHSGFRHPVTPESFIMENFANGIRRAPIHGLLDGIEVFSFAISKVPQLLNELLFENNLNKDDDIDYFLLHQANRMINEKIIRKIQIKQSKAPSNIEEYANSSCSSIPLLMVTRIREAMKENNLNLILSAFGVGLTWDCINIKTHKIVCPQLIEI